MDYHQALTAARWLPVTIFTPYARMLEVNGPWLGKGRAVN
jgi:hypothetical protein